MNNRENIIYLNKKESKQKRKNRKRFRMFNLILLFLAAYFVITIGRQEFKLREIQAQTVAANQEYEALKQQEGVINKKISDVSSTHVVESKAKSILGWVKENEYKVIEQVK